MEHTVLRETAPDISVDVRKIVPWIYFIIFFAVLNETVFNVSTPAIARQFALSASQVSWVMTTFIVIFGVGSVIYGKLSDIYSLKTLIVMGIVVYCAGSALGLALQFSYPMVIVARAVQGAGASAIPALGIVVVARYVPPEERGRIFGTITSTIAFAIGIGPVLGGFVTGTLHWSILFAVPLFTLISIPNFRRVLPNEERKAGTVDIPGAIMIAGGIGSLMLYITFSDWYYLAASIVLLAGFVLDVLFAKNPFIDLVLLRNSVFRKRVYVRFIVFAVVTGVLFVVPLMLSSVGLSTNRIGLILFPGAMCAAALGTYGGNLADRRGNTYVINIGFALLAGSFLLLSAVIGYSYIAVAAIMVMTYIGFNFTQTALMNSVSQILEPHETGVGMGLFNLVGFVSGAIGTALVGRYLEGGWLSFWQNPLASDSRVAPYSNLLVVFAVLVGVGALIYYASHRQATRRRLSVVEALGGCADDSPPECWEAV